MKAEDGCDREKPERETGDTEDGLDPVCQEDPHPRYRPNSPKETRVPASGRPLMRPFCCFLNLGSKQKPYIGRRSEYRRAWIIANGAPPRKRQVCSKRVFVGKCFEVEIGDVETRFDQRPHPEGEIYSRVKQIIKRTIP